MYYVYIIQSISCPGQIYIGLTNSLTIRIKQHNAGQSLHTAKYLPWKVICYTAFENKEKAVEFEQFLKTGYFSPLMVSK